MSDFAEILDVFFNGRPALFRKEDFEAPWMRGLFLEINAEFERLGCPHKVNAGSSPCDCTGESLKSALTKVRDNLKLLRVKA